MGTEGKVITIQRRDKGSMDKQHISILGRKDAMSWGDPGRSRKL